MEDKPSAPKDRAGQTPAQEILGQLSLVVRARGLLLGMDLVFPCKTLTYSQVAHMSLSVPSPLGSAHNCWLEQEVQKQLREPFNAP